MSFAVIGKHGSVLFPKPPPIVWDSHRGKLPGFGTTWPENQNCPSQRFKDIIGKYELYITHICFL